MLIWRVENEKGEGCYRGKPTQHILSRHRNLLTHPHPLEDLGIGRLPYPNEISGFLTQAQAFNWFNKEELQDLKKIGYDLKAVTVKSISAYGGHQILAIKRDTATTLAERLFKNAMEAY